MPATRDATKVDIYQMYEEQCQREGVVDFGELMLRSYELLRDNDPIREHYQRRFRHILIDEFQDTNRLQYAWIKLLAGRAVTPSPTRPLVRCWRWVTTTKASTPSGRARGQHGRLRAGVSGAPPDQAGAELPQPQQHPGQRQRAHQPQRQASGQEPAHRPGTGRARCVCTRPPPTSPKAQWLVEERQPLARPGRRRVTRDAKSPFSTAAMPKPCDGKRRCSTPGVPYRVYGGLRFFERAEIKHALAYLRLLENPNDDTSFLRVVNFPRVASVRVARAAAGSGAGHGLLPARCGQRLGGRAKGAAIAGFVAKIDVLREQTADMNLRDISPDARPKRLAGPLPGRPRR